MTWRLPTSGGSRFFSISSLANTRNLVMKLGDRRKLGKLGDRRDVFHIFFPSRNQDSSVGVPRKLLGVRLSVRSIVAGLSLPMSSQTIPHPKVAPCACTRESPQVRLASLRSPNTLSSFPSTSACSIRSSPDQPILPHLRNAPSRSTTAIIPPDRPSPPAQDSAPHIATPSTNDFHPRGKNKTAPARHVRSTDVWHSSTSRSVRVFALALSPASPSSAVPPADARDSTSGSSPTSTIHKAPCTCAADLDRPCVLRRSPKGTAAHSRAASRGAPH